MSVAVETFDASYGSTEAFPGNTQDIRVSSATQLVRFLVEIQQLAADPPADFMATSVFFACMTGSLVTSADWTAAANAVLTCFNGTFDPGGGNAFTRYVNCGITIKAYDLADIKPRPVKATVVYTPTTWFLSNNLGPNELAIPLRFYSTRNVKTQRGRIYTGAVRDSDSLRTIPAATTTAVRNLGTALFHISAGSPFAVNTGVWCLWARTANLFWPVTNWWVNDQWAHMESREHVETTRATQFGSPYTTDSIHGPAIP